MKQFNGKLENDQYISGNETDPANVLRGQTLDSVEFLEIQPSTTLIIIIIIAIIKRNKIKAKKQKLDLRNEQSNLSLFQADKVLQTGQTKKKKENCQLLFTILYAFIFPRSSLLVNFQYQTIENTRYYYLLVNLSNFKLKMDSSSGTN